MARKALKNIREKENKLEMEEERIEQEEKDILTQENKIEADEQKLLEEQQHIEEMTMDIEKKLTDKPLQKVTMRDITKGLIGAFVGVVAHFAFIETTHIAENIDYTRATTLYILSYVIGFLFIYKTGFRDVREIKLMKFLPVRVTVIYVTCIVVILIVLFLFNLVELHNFGLLYKQVAVTSILAILGAGTADMIGRE
ncbi:MAG: DUF2391 family protein [Nanoarchaeota archaeon]